MTDKPGIYPDVPARLYHALPYLGSGALHTLIEECAAQYRHDADHPEDNDPSRALEIGSVAHLLALEPHLFDERVRIIEAPSYQGGKAKEARAAAYDNDLLPIIEDDLATANAMNTALRRRVGDLLDGGRSELSLVHRDEHTGVMLKARIDMAKPKLLLDYKTTASVHPEAIRRRVMDNGHHIQMAHYLDIWQALTGEEAQWRWIWQSTKPPYLVSMPPIMPSVLEWGRIQARGAIDLFAACQRSGEWPSYDETPIELPEYALYQLRTRDERGDFVRHRQQHAAKGKAVNPAARDRAIAAFAP